jgi:transcriptional regulator with XRE-family HTH domain
MKMNASFHQKLKRMREAKGWSPAHLAKRSGLKEGLIARLEADPREVPSWPSISRLSNALGTNPYYLATGDGDGRPFHARRAPFVDTAYSGERQASRPS